MDEKELENKNEQKETLDNADIGKISVVTKHEIAMALFNFCHNIYIAFGIFILACRVLKFDMSAQAGFCLRLHILHLPFSYCCLPHASGVKLNKKANRFISEACFLVYWFWQQSLGLSCFV